MSLQALGLQALRRLLFRLSWTGVDRLAVLIGAAFHILVVPRRTIALRNLKTAFGNGRSYAEADRIALHASIHFVQSMMHFLRLPSVKETEITASVSLNGIEHYVDATRRGRGVIILTAHFGNWELLGARLVLGGIPLSVIARERSNAALARIINQTRRAAGMRVIEKDAPMLAAARVLRQNAAIGILPDQHAGNQGIPLPFFGRVTQMHPVVARLARSTGAGVLPTYCLRVAGGRYVARIHPMLVLQQTTDKEADIFENTRRMTHVLEEQIRSAPDQWLWVHKRWRDHDRHLAEWYPRIPPKALLRGRPDSWREPHLRARPVDQRRASRGGGRTAAMLSEAATLTRAGERSQSDIRLETIDGRASLVKDYARMRGWRRWFSRWIIAREHRAYQFLTACPGTVACLGRETPLSLRLSYVEGRLCDEFAAGELPDAFFDGLREVVEAIHARGVAHNDLKRKRNIIVTDDYQPIVIDFAAAWWIRPRWNPLRRWIFGQLCEVDRNAICKLKKRLAPHLLTEQDVRRLERPTVLERWARRLLNR